MAKTQRQREIEAKARANLARQNLPQRSAGVGGREYTAAGAMANIAPSAQQYGSDLATIFTDPLLVAQGIKEMFTGDGLEQLGGFYATRYGSVRQALQTAYDDPVGFMSDVSLVGAPTKLAANLAKIAAKKTGKGQTAAQVMQRTGSALEAADPFGAATALTLGAASSVPIVRSFPESTYETNLKMGTSPRSRMGQQETRQQVIGTLLEEGIPVSPEGLTQLNKIISNRTADLDRLIDIAEQQGKTISLYDIAVPIRELRNELGNPRTNPTAAADVKVIEDYLASWADEVGDAQNLTPSEVRKLRQNLDNRLNYDRISATTPPLQTRITEEAATGARGALRETIEGYGETGMDISKLLTAQEALERAVNRLGQNQTIGLRQTIGATGGFGAMGGTDVVQQISGALLAGGALLMTPQNKERIAQIIYNSRNLTSEQKRSLASQLASQTGPTAQRIQEGREEQQ
tara:strand:- start:152 stop:1537 length:1386 start_codon:yes stop_codon:yes gene_type:complete